uniref:VWFA domain-containing protein n=1 Tax=Plectus sambesii TaxID=2011161 RepID=A0A914VV70_9BILA
MGLTVGIVGLVIGVVLATRPHTCSCPGILSNCTSANVAPFYFSARLKTIVWNDSLSYKTSPQYYQTRLTAIQQLSDILNQVQPTFYRDIAQSGDVALQLDVTRFEQMQGGDDHAVAYASGAYIGPPSKLPTMLQITNALNANTTVDYVNVTSSSTDMCNGVYIPTVTTAAPSTFSTQSGVTTTTSMLITTTTTQPSCPQPTPCPPTPTPVICPPPPPTPSCASATTQSTIPAATGAPSAAPTTSVVPLTSSLPGGATSAAPPGTAATGAPITAAPQGTTAPLGIYTTGASMTAASQGPTIMPGTSATGGSITGATQGPTVAPGTSATGVPMTAGSQGPTAAPGTSATGGSITGATQGPTVAPGTSATGVPMTAGSQGPTAAPGTSATGGSMTVASQGPTVAPGTSATGVPMTAGSQGPTAAPGTSATGGSMTVASQGPTVAPGTSATGVPMTAGSQGPTAAPGTSATGGSMTVASQGPTVPPVTSAPTSGGSTPGSPPQSAAPTTVAATSQLPTASTGALTTAGMTSVTTGYTAPSTIKRLYQNIAIVYDMSEASSNPSLLNATYAYLTSTFINSWTIEANHANVAPVPFPNTDDYDSSGGIGNFQLGQAKSSVINQFRLQYQILQGSQGLFSAPNVSDINIGINYVQTHLINDTTNRPNVINTVIVLATSVSEVNSAMATANALKNSGITILTIALGGADANTLGSLASSPNNIFSLQDPSNQPASTATATAVYNALLNIPNGSVVEPVG